MKFYQGLEIRYKENEGIVNFIGNSYITLTLFQNSSNLLIYAEEWKDVYPLQGNRGEEQ